MSGDPTCAVVDVGPVDGVSPGPRADGGGDLVVALHALAAGNLTALDDIYDRCGEDLFGIALWRCGSREDAADAVQEVFVRLARARGGLGRVEKLKAYLLAMAHQAALDIVRRRRRSSPDAGRMAGRPFPLASGSYLVFRDGRGNGPLSTDHCPRRPSSEVR